MTADRLISPQLMEGDVQEKSLRPSTLSDFIGQANACQNLKIFIEAAR